jgi:hypothetical protein
MLDFMHRTLANKELTILEHSHCANDIMLGYAQDISNTHITPIHAELFGVSILCPFSNFLGSSTGLIPG